MNEYTYIHEMFSERALYEFPIACYLPRLQCGALVYAYPYSYSQRYYQLHTLDDKGNKVIKILKPSADSEDKSLYNVTSEFPGG